MRGCQQREKGPPPPQGCLGVSGKSQFLSLGGIFYAHNLLYLDQRLQLSGMVTGFPEAARPGVLRTNEHGGGGGVLRGPAADVTQTGARLRLLNGSGES